VSQDSVDDVLVLDATVRRIDYEPDGGPGNVPAQALSLISLASFTTHASVEGEPNVAMGDIPKTLEEFSGPS
jgi:hypothetical protein